jgi:SAM-dependent methyltransferase
VELLLNPSPWVRRHAALIPDRRGGARVLDLACGSGRHVRWLAGRGCRVTAVDRDAAAVEPLRTIAEVVVADIENGPWPFDARRDFDAVVVTNYLWRALLPRIVDCVAPGGVLIYETFAHGNAAFGRPARPEFLLQPGELIDAVRPALHIVAYEDGFLDGPPRRVQRIAAVRKTSETAESLQSCQLESWDHKDQCT